MRNRIRKILQESINDKELVSLQTQSIISKAVSEYGYIVNKESIFLDILKEQGYKNHIMYIDSSIDEKYRNFIIKNKFPDPKYNCQDESIRWAKLLYDTFGNELDIEFCGGYFIWNEELEGHWWLRLNGGVFDPTIGQFRNNLRGISFENYEVDEVDKYPFEEDHMDGF